ncbi:MAG: hypothetical protein M1829_003686 [Trizodia sp. TS-e1964]|nr:MAG: hypothetical protein M1829_003686 [Trizodia sp. TS-e1964]
MPSSNNSSSRFPITFLAILSLLQSVAFSILLPLPPTPTTAPPQTEDPVHCNGRLALLWLNHPQEIGCVTQSSGRLPSQSSESGICGEFKVQTVIGELRISYDIPSISQERVDVLYSGLQEVSKSEPIPALKSGLKKPPSDYPLQWKAPSKEPGSWPGEWPLLSHLQNADTGSPWFAAKRLNEKYLHEHLFSASLDAPANNKDDNIFAIVCNADLQRVQRLQNLLNW